MGDNASSSDAVAQADQLSLDFDTADGPVHALCGIDLTIRAGEFVSLIGPSGCGKTTLLRVIADLEKHSSGEILVNGVSPDQARQSLLGLCVSGPRTLPVANCHKECRTAP